MSDQPPRLGSDQATPVLPYGAELSRKALHGVALVLPLYMALAGKGWAVAVLTPLALLAVGADVLRVRSGAFATFIDRFFAFMMRAAERPPVGGGVAINGATWVMVSAALLTWIFPVRIAASAFTIVVVSDAAAALVGRRLGRHRWGGTSRTVEGSLAFIATGTLVAAFFHWLTLWVAVAGVLCGAAAEIPPRPLDDNVRVPLVVATIIFVLERFVLGTHVSIFFF